MLPLENTQLLAWVLLCLVAAWFLRYRPLLGAGAVLTLWFAVPSIAAGQLTGVSSGNAALHPATWLVLCLVLVCLVTHPGPMADTVARHPWVALVTVLFVLGALVTSILERSGGNRLLFDQIIGPAALFWLVVTFGSRRQRGLLALRNLLLVLVAAQCVLAVFQQQAGETLLYTADFASRASSTRSTVRWFGTTDSPLVLSLAICAAAALTLGLKRAPVRMVLLTLFVVGSLITQSRTGVVITSALVLWTILRSRSALWAKAASLALVAVAGVWLLQSPVVAGVTSRFGNDTGSTEARVLALEYVAGRWQDWLVVGQGLTSSYDYARDGGLGTSIESSYLMYAVDLGFVLATLYFGMQLVLVLLYGRQWRVPGATAAAAVCCLLQHTFSSTAASNVAGVVIWTTLAFVVAGHARLVARVPAQPAVVAAAPMRATSSAL